MLPCRFAHRKEKAKYEVAPRPFINEMGKGAGNYDKYNTRNGVTFQFIIHKRYCTQRKEQICRKYLRRLLMIWKIGSMQTDNHINVGFEVVFLNAISNDNYRHDLGYWIGKSEVIGNIFDNPELLEVEE